MRRSREFHLPREERYAKVRTQSRLRREHTRAIWLGVAAIGLAVLLAGSLWLEWEVRHNRLMQLQPPGVRTGTLGDVDLGTATVVSLTIAEGVRILIAGIAALLVVQAIALLTNRHYPRLRRGIALFAWVAAAISIPAVVFGWAIFRDGGIYLPVEATEALAAWIVLAMVTLFELVWCRPPRDDLALAVPARVEPTPEPPSNGATP